MRTAYSAVLGALIVSFSTAALAQDFTFSLAVDKTVVEVGQSIELTLTMQGDIAGIELPAFEFPEAFSIAARRKQTSLSFRGAQSQHSLSLIYVLVAQEAGTYQLGPFVVAHRGTNAATEPIEITVEQPALPPDIAAPRSEFTI